MISRIMKTEEDVYSLAEVDNSLRDLKHNSSSRYTKAEFDNYFIIHSKYF